MEREATRVSAVPFDVRQPAVRSTAICRSDVWAAASPGSFVRDHMPCQITLRVDGLGKEMSAVAEWLKGLPFAVRLTPRIDARTVPFGPALNVTTSSPLTWTNPKGPVHSVRVRWTTTGSI